MIDTPATSHLADGECAASAPDGRVGPGTKAAAIQPRYALGVLFVHGIGNQTRGSTLTDFGTPLVEWLKARGKQSKADVTLGNTVLTLAPDEPAFSELTLGCGKQMSRWLLAESWWAESFPVARFNDVTKWSLLIVPWTIGTHFARRLARVGAHGRLWKRISAVATLVGALLLSPGILLILVILLMLGMIPWPQLQTAVAKIQRVIASSLGDSYMLVTRPLEAAAIRSRVRRDLEWLLGQCRRVAVVAHSQGGAIACQVIASSPQGAQLLITVGSGLRKLEELDDAHRRGGLLKGAMLSVAGLVVAGLMIAAAPLVAYQVYQGTASPASAVVVAAAALVGLVFGIIGLQRFIHATEPTNLTILSADLGFRGVQWEDVYASADPVSNGFLHDDGRDPPTSTEVLNFRSTLSDHTGYWRNHDEFVSFIAEKLIAFGGAGNLHSASPDSVTFVRRYRAVRVRALHTLRWATVGCVVALLLRYPAEWLAVTAWASQRGLAWAGNLVGYALAAVPTPDAAVWRRTLGWLAAVVAVNWLTRAAWSMWNDSAMEDAARGVYHTRDPYALLLLFWAQLFLPAFAVLASPTRSVVRLLVRPNGVARPNRGRSAQANALRGFRAGEGIDPAAADAAADAP